MRYIKTDRAIGISKTTANILDSLNYRFLETIVQFNFVSIFSCIKLYFHVCFSVGFPSTLCQGRNTQTVYIS